MRAEKLYVVSRADMPPGPQAVQGMHSMRQFAAEHPGRELEWFERSNHIAFLSVRGLRELEDLRRLADLDRIPSSFFEEPDMGGQRTSLTLGPEARRICARLGLALRM